MGNKYSKCKSEEERLERIKTAYQRYYESGKGRERQKEYNERNYVKVHYKGILKARERRGYPVADAPTVEQVIAALGERPNGTDEYQWVISFTEGNDLSCFKKSNGETPSTLKLENCHWAKALKRGVAKKIIESELCPDDHKCSDRMIIRRFHKLGEDISRISGVKERRLVVDDEVVGSVYGRLQCIGLERSYNKQNRLVTKCLMNCMVCGHKFKRRLAAVRKGSHLCLKCQHSAEQSKGQTFNSATCVWGELHLITEHDMIYLDDAHQFIGAFTMNNSRPEYIEAWADVMILSKGDELDITAY